MKVAAENKPVGAIVASRGCCKLNDVAATAARRNDSMQLAG